MLTLDQFNYQLPKELIAHEPVKPRDHSRLMQLGRTTGKISHHWFYELDQLLKPGDVLVRNNTKVIMARLLGQKETGGKIEILLNKPTKPSQWHTWECLTKPGLKVGAKITIESINHQTRLTGTCIGLGQDGFTRIIKFDYQGDFFQLLNQVGEVPLPPYIKPSKQLQELKKLYQTQFAKKAGSVAAPTAGLHFTKTLEEKLLKKGIQIEEITLHVGMGTFAPVKEEDVTEHQMHSEYFELTQNVAKRLNQAKKTGRRIIAVGTTSVRVLESCTTSNSQITTLKSQTGETDIFIYPPYQFKFVDGLITNFHLPHSTLLMLVSAFVSYPNTKEKFSHFQSSLVGKAYQEAIEKKYRFYSFGDGMLII